MNSTSLSAPSFAGVSNSVGLQFTLQWYLDRSLRGSRTLLLLLLLAFSFTARLLSAAEVATDKTDYPPGSTVQITGSGFQAEELVQCQVVHSDGLAGGSGHEPWMVTANASGDVATSWFVAPDDSVGASLLLTATGQASGLVATATFTDSFGPGTASVIFPAGGFAIDGDLEANVPTVGLGDWVPHTPGAGGSVLTSAGVPLNSANTFHLTDLYDADEDNFAGGLKYFDNPKTWTWVNTNKAPAKNDINHGLLHFSTDASGNTWLAVASDRFSENGDAYIDFEFLQNSLTMTGTDGGTKGFASAGPDGGRTVGDFLLTLSLTHGGSVAGFKVEIWEPDTGVPLGYTYHDRTGLVPAGSVYAAVNTAPVPVSFGAFGGVTYDVNTFVEGAVNLTAMLGAIDPCTSLGVKTVLIKCKTSQSDTATITDFIAPLQIDKRIGIADAGSDQVKCSEGASTSFTLAGVATVPSPDVVSSTTWSVVSGTATIASPGNLDSTVSVSSPTATLRLTVVTSPNNCVVTDDVVLAVRPVPDCAITGADGPLCPNLGGNQYSGVAGLSSYAWSISGNGSISGVANTQIVSVTAGAGCASTFTLTLTVTNANGCSNTCTKTVNVEDTAPPVIAELPGESTIECPAVPVFANATAKDDCAGAVTPEGVVTSSGTCPVVWTKTWTATDVCGNSSTAKQVIKVIDTTPPVIAELPGESTIECPAVPVFKDATAKDDCDGTVTPEGVVTRSGTCPVVWTKTWTATDACGNSSTAKQVIKVVDTTPPVIAELPGVSTIGCPAVPVFANATAKDDCDGTVTPEGVVTSSGTYPVVWTKTWTATDACGNSSTASQTINVEDNTPPVVICPPSVSVPYPTVPLPATTVEELVGLGGSASDTCSAVTISSSDSVASGSCPVIARTYTVTDESGNASTCEQTIAQICSPSLVTNSSLCTFDVDSNCDDAFRLNFQQRTDVQGLWRIVSSNPGQFYYNFFVNGAPGDDVNATATIPYPFVTHGAQPVHVYSDYTITGSEEAGYCLIPGTGLRGFTITTAGGQKSNSGAAIIVLGDYTLATPTTTVNVTGGKIPASGTICVTIHLDYALKKTNEWTQSSGAAVGNGSLTGVTLDPCQEYAFSFTDGVVSGRQIVHSVNGFKKNTGFAASIVTSAELGSTPLQGVKFEAWNSTGITKIGQGFTGADGSGLIPYKQKAQVEDYWIKVPAYQKALKVTVKANGFGFGEFEVP